MDMPPAAQTFKQAPKAEPPKPDQVALEARAALAGSYQLVRWPGGCPRGSGDALHYIPGVTTGFTDYVLPMVGSLPCGPSGDHASGAMEVILVEVPSLHGPLGAKGLGEAAILPAAPAVANAVSRAIGARVRQLPMTPPVVLKAIREAGLPVLQGGTHCRRSRDPQGVL